MIRKCLDSYGENKVKSGRSAAAWDAQFVALNFLFGHDSISKSVWPLTLIDGIYPGTIYSYYFNLRNASIKVKWYDKMMICLADVNVKLFYNVSGVKTYFIFK